VWATGTWFSPLSGRTFRLLKGHHGQLALLFWACGEVASQKVLAKPVKPNHSSHGLEARERRKGVASHMPFQGHDPQNLKITPYAPLLKGSLPPNSTKLGTKPLTHRSLGDMPNPNYSTWQVPLPHSSPLSSFSSCTSTTFLSTHCNDNWEYLLRLFSAFAVLRLNSNDSFLGGFPLSDLHIYLQISFASTTTACTYL
jgi:hypothetical protein